MQEQLADYLVGNTAIDVPEGLSARQTERSLARRAVELLQAGVPWEQANKAVDDLRAKARDQVVRDLKLFFILERIAEERGITVSEEQLNGAIAEIAQRTQKRFDRVRDELARGEGMSLLWMRLREQATLDALLAEAQITETESPKKTGRGKRTKPKSAKAAAEDST
jgi:trigger factor